MKKGLLVFIALLLTSVIYKISITSKAESSEEEPSDMVIHEAGECHTLDDNFTFCIPVQTLESQNLLVRLQDTNVYLTFFNILKDDSIENLSSLCVSVYENERPLPMDSAFEFHLRTRESDDMEEDYRMISNNKYSVDSRTFYQKVSLRGTDICSVMHYFMKNEYSNKVYEIKVVGHMDEHDKLKTLAENIALTAHFQENNRPEDDVDGSGQLVLR